MHACMHEHYIQYIFYTIDTAELYGAIYIVPPTYIMMLKCLLVIVDKHTEICNHANSNRSNCNWPRATGVVTRPAVDPFDLSEDQIKLSRGLLSFSQVTGRKK